MDLNSFFFLCSFSYYFVSAFGMRVRSENHPTGQAITDKMTKEDSSGAAMGNPPVFQNLEFLCGNGSWDFFISSFC